MELISDNIRKSIKATFEVIDRFLPSDLAGFIITQNILGDGDETTLALATKIVSALYRGVQKKLIVFKDRENYQRALKSIAVNFKQLVLHIVSEMKLLDLDLVLISIVIDDDISALSIIYKQSLASDVFNYIKQNQNNVAVIISNKNVDVDAILNKSIGFLNKHGKKHYREVIKHIQFSNIYTIILTLDTDNVIKIKLREDYGKESSLTIPINTPAWSVNDLPEKIREDLRTLIIDPIIAHANYAPHGIIIVGPPGVGKSVTAEALANALGKRVVRINPGVYRSMWYGMTEKILSSIFSSLRRRKDIVVLIDDADFLVSRFNAIHEAFIAEMNIWLNILQERQRPLIIMTTNTPEIMDPALIRPGRLDIAIFMGYPDRKMRESIISNLCRIYNIKVANETLINDIAYKTKWFNAAELDSLVRIAASKGKGVITEDSVEWALKKFHINHSERRLIQDNIESYASKMSNVVISYIPKEHEI